MLNVVCLPGDGIGPEVTRAMKKVVAATGVQINWIDMPAGLGAVGEFGTPMPAETLDMIAEFKLAIKGPTNTPKGEGHSSVNVQLRRHFDLHVGFRPYQSLPLAGLKDRPKLDITLFRQNTEGLYACTEELVAGAKGDEVVLTAKFTAWAMTRLAQVAFKFALDRGKTLVTLVTKSNIHKAWGKLYNDAFMKVADGYRKHGIDAEEMLVDATSMILVTNPARYQVLVTENMFGDILSDELAGLIGGLGVAPGANIGEDMAIFEAVHGSADDIAGKDLANPTALVLSGAMLLEHVGATAEASRIRWAVSEAFLSDVVTGDLRRYIPAGKLGVSTTAYTDLLCTLIARRTKADR